MYPIAPPAVGESAWRHMFGHLSGMTGCFVTETEFAKIMKESLVSMLNNQDAFKLNATPYTLISFQQSNSQ